MREVTHRDAVLIAGAGRAILLQLACPPVGHGVAEHSDFVTDPLRRLRHTLTYVYAVVTGTPEQRDAAVRFVNRSHAVVRSSPDDDVQDATGAATPGPASGRVRYDANDPHLQLWVAATLYQTTERVIELVEGRPLTASRREQLYRDSQAIGTALHVPVELWPADSSAFAVYWRDMLTTLSVDATTLGVSRQLLYSRTGPLWLRAMMPLARLLTAGLLPDDVRAAFELPWTRGRARFFRATMWSVRVLHPAVPRRVREWPRTALLKGL